MPIDAPPRTGPSRPPRVEVRWRPGALELRDEEVFGAAEEGLCLRFLARVFSVPEVESVRVDRPSASALVRYRFGSGGDEVVRKMAAAIRGIESSPPRGGLAAPLLTRDLSGPRWTVHRHRGVLSTWEVVVHRAGLLALKHDSLTSTPALAQRIALAMEAVGGVRSVRLGSLGRTLRIRFDPSRTQSERLLRTLETAFTRLQAEPGGEAVPHSVSFGLANTSVALAVVSDLVVPGLWPATALLLVGSNLGTFRKAADQMGRGELGLPVLYTGIAAATLATGQFVPWAAMGWMMRYWKHRSQQELAAGTRRLLGDLIQQPRFARLETAAGLEVEVPSDRLGAGDVILVSAGETLPRDGQVLSGHGLVDERMVRGAAGLTPKRPDDRVLAGSLVLTGDLEVKASPPSRVQRPRLVAEAIRAAVAPVPGDRTPTRKGERFAGRFVAPTLATAGLGLVLGGAPMALAIMRADYASGPGLAYPLEVLQACAICVREGIVIRDPEVLERLAAIDVLLLEHQPAFEAGEIEVAGIRVFPGHSESEVLRFAASALKDLDDARAPALRGACRARRIPLMDRIPIEYGADVTLVHDGRIIKVGNLGERVPERDRLERAAGRALTPPIDSLMVGVDGRIAGLVDFRPSERLRAAADLQRLRERAGRPLAIGLVWCGDRGGSPGLASRLGVDFQQGGLSTAGLARLIQGCRRRGLKVAYAGDCVTRARAAAEADLAISTTESGIDQLPENPASVALLRPDINLLAVLEEAARVYRKRVRLAEGSSLIPNVLCAVGSLTLGLTSLTTVIVTNLATYSTFARTTRAVNQLDARLRRGGRSPHPPQRGVQTHP